MEPDVNDGADEIKAETYEAMAGLTCGRTSGARFTKAPLHFLCSIEQQRSLFLSVVARRRGRLRSKDVQVFGLGGIRFS